MKFIEKVNGLINTYEKEACAIMDQAVLYGVYDQTPPLAEHIIFNSMPADLVKDLVASYKLPFPKELLTLYSVMNGATFFWTVCFIGEKQTRIPFSRLRVYGVPLTTDRKHIEPFNISVEDLNRPKGTPKNWLKFGSFSDPKEQFVDLDLFTDVDTGDAFAVKHGAKDCCVVYNWNSIDECLCFVFDLLSNQRF